VINIYDETPYGTIIQRLYYNTSGKLVTQLGHIKVIRDCCGKIISKCLEFVDDSDNEVHNGMLLREIKKRQCFRIYCFKSRGRICGI